MPVHNWTRVQAGGFHHFHHSWTTTIAHALNQGGLPPEYYALAERTTDGVVPDVVALKARPRKVPRPHSEAIEVAVAPPRARFRMESDSASYAQRANRIAVRHRDGTVVAVIEIVSPGNKDSKHAIASFTRKAAGCLRNGTHLLVLDLFPPNRRAPQGIHKAIWDRVRDEFFELPPDKPLTLASYEAGPTIVAYVEPVAVGDVLPDMPLFLAEGLYVPCPLEATYLEAWGHVPWPLVEELEGPQENGHP